MLNKNLLIAVFSLSVGAGKCQNYQQAAQCSLSLTISSGNVTCYGFNDGFASVLPMNGISPYTYLWSSGGTSSSITALAPSGYFITVCDSSGCTLTDSVTITEPAALEALMYWGNSSCYYQYPTCEGFAYYNNVTGGTPPYTYEWRDMFGGIYSINDYLSMACAGTYIGSVTDSNACNTSDTVVFLNPPQLFMTISDVNAICSTCVGSANIQLTGGSPPYHFYWDNNPSIISISSGDLTSSITALPGTYSVDIMSVGECTLSTSVTIGWAEECWKLAANINVPGYIFTMTDSGAVVQFTFNGANAANYFWDFGDGNTSTVQNPVHAYTNPGIYTVMLVGSNGYCSDTAYVTITILDVGMDKFGFYSDSWFKIQPNPASNNVTITAMGGDEIIITDIAGRKIKEYKFSDNQIKINAGEYDNGIYFLTLYNGQQFISTKKFVIAK